MSEYFKLLQQSSTANNIDSNTMLPVQATVQHDTLQSISIDVLVPYKDNPFKPYSTEALEELSQSIRENGLIVPVLIRPYDGRYQIISGHNRVKAIALLDEKTVPAIVRQMSDDEAAIVLVETNFRNRTSFLHSEKAKAYKLEYEAKQAQMKAMGTLYPQQRTSEIIAEAAGESEKRIRQYVKVADLIEPLLNWLDHNKLPFLSAYYLAFLSVEEQKIVCAYFQTKEPIGMELAETLKNSSGNISEEFLKQVTGTKKKGTGIKQIKIKYKKIETFFQANESAEEIENIIIKALKQYYNKE